MTGEKLTVTPDPVHWYFIEILKADKLIRVYTVC